MARTALFSRLRSVVGRAPELHRRARAAREVAAGSPSISRRRLLGAGAGLGLGGCSPSRGRAPLTALTPTPRVAVIGGGLAGLHCAFRLAQGGADVTLYEANSRLGGRAFTGRRLLRDSKLICELGGEFIDSDHTMMLALARELGVPLDERYGAEALQRETYWLNGKEIPEATLISQLAAVSPAILAGLSAADVDASVFRDLDNTTLQSFLEQHVPAHKYPELSPLLGAAFRAEFGLEPDQQSALNLLHLLDPADAATTSALSGGLRFHARAGNDSFATQLSSTAALRDRIKLNSRLAAIRVNTSSLGSTFSMAFETQTASGFVVEAEHVVFAVPFSVLRQLDSSALTLSAPKRKLVAELGYGTHSRLLGAFKPRVWRDQQRSGSVTSDLSFQQVWDASLGQTDPQGIGILSNLVSGDAGARANAPDVPAAMAALLSELNGPLPGVSNAFIAGSAVRMHWPSAPLFRGSYASYRPGQWSLRGNEGRPEGNVHFCGEHCSVDFQGRMEGAVETGALVAARLLDDLDLPWPSALVDLLAPKLVVLQPCYDGTTGAELGFLERRAKLRHEALPDAR